LKNSTKIRTFKNNFECWQNLANLLSFEPSLHHRQKRSSFIWFIAFDMFTDSVVLTMTPFYAEGRTSRSAITAKPCCSVCKLWQKYKCEKRASNIALSYGAKGISKCWAV